MTGDIVMKETDITDEEAALYDRQIRLWGVNAQKKLRKSQVLIIGLGGVGAEIAKNIILAGVGGVVLLDDKIANVENCKNQFFVPKNLYGTNRAVASVERAQVLNPMVTVTADIQHISEKASEFYKEFDLVCLTDSSEKEINEINNICRNVGVKFLSTSCWGLAGYIFLDLQLHEYLFELQPKGINVDSDCKRKPSEVETSSKVEKRTAEFLPFSETMRIDWKSDRFCKRLKRISPMFFIMQIIHEFIDTYHRIPLPDDVPRLQDIKNSFVARNKVPDDKIPEELLRIIHGECNPICAIIGGVAGQEVIKALSHQDEPINNYFFFEALTNHGVVEYLGH